MRIGNKFYYKGNKIAEISKKPSEKMKESGIVVQADLYYINGRDKVEKMLKGGIYDELYHRV